jgi:hypothetical protein
MNQTFQGWDAVAKCLIEYVHQQQQLADGKGETATRLNLGQRASIYAIAERITANGMIVADEVGMGKTRIAVEVARAVVKCGGRVAILVPPGLGNQWLTELREGGVEAPEILRSLWAYLAAWRADRPEPWFASSVVMLSHAFTNWRLGENAAPWRWALLPEVYARWRSRTYNRLPYGYHGNSVLTDREVLDAGVRNAGESITDAIPDARGHQARRLLDKFLEDVQWPKTLRRDEYSQDGTLRVWLERIVGLGLGIFDLMIIDEAHKSRSKESRLSSLVDNVVAVSANARRLALTATPVELDVAQWQDTLGRIGLTEAALGPINASITQYAAAVSRVQQSWRSSEDARQDYKVAATQFQQKLSPYLLRRDKREDPDVRRFSEYTRRNFNEYRLEREIVVDTASLSPAWRQAVCAAEALSVAVRQAEDPVAKRLRLTFGNGHGIAALLDQIKRDEHESAPVDLIVENAADPKRRERAQWWLKAIESAFSQAGDSLFDHPALGAAVSAIEEATRADEKVLVFGRFTRPLRALVDLLNAREMLRRLRANLSWPRAKVHGDRNGDPTSSEWPAVRAAFRQLQTRMGSDPLDEHELDKELATRYERDQRQRQRERRRDLIPLIEQGLKEVNSSQRISAVFTAFKRAAKGQARRQATERHPLALVDRATMELLGNDPSHEASSSDYGRIFCELIEASSDRDDPDHDQELEDGVADALWETLEDRLHEEYNRPQGGFARLMYGGTSQESRRMIQLAFNRQNSFPKVLVAQSMVGREGLNLHKACRIVVMLHPEWNPGVVEQQIGRVDRVGSHWCTALETAIKRGEQADRVPRIEFRPVIFRGT